MKVEKTFTTKEVTKTVEVPEYVLHLTEKEAEMLLLVVGDVLGPDSSSPWFINSIYSHLTDLGVKSLYASDAKYKGIKHLNIPTPKGDTK